MLPTRIASCLLLSCLCAASTARADVNYGDYEFVKYVGDARPFDKWDPTAFDREPNANTGFFSPSITFEMPTGQFIDDTPSAYYVTQLTQKLFKPLPQAAPGARPSKSR